MARNQTWNWHIHYGEDGKIAFVCASVQAINGEYLDGASSESPTAVIEWVKNNYPEAVCIGLA